MSKENLNAVGIVANRLVDSWQDVMSAKGAMAFRTADEKREAVLKFAEDLGIRDEVMSYANKIWRGEN